MKSLKRQYGKSEGFGVLGLAVFWGFAYFVATSIGII